MTANLGAAMKARLASLHDDAGALMEEIGDIDLIDSVLQGLADAVARLHYAEHEGALRFCAREVCKKAHEIGTEVVA